MTSLKQSWYSLDPEQTVKKLNTDESGGLSHREAKRRLERDGKNVITPVSRNTFYRCLKHMMLDSTAILLLITAFLAWLFEADKNAIVLAVIVLIHLVLTLIVYFRSERVLESTERFTMPLSYVIRQGKLFLINQKYVARGDVICLSAGDIVPADCRLLRCEDLIVDESLLDEGATAVPKLAEIVYDENHTGPIGNMVFGGTQVISGTGVACVVAVGKNCKASGKKEAVYGEGHENMPHLTALRKYSKIRSLFLIGSVLFFMVLVLVMTADGDRLFPTLLTALTYAVSAMSELLAIFCSIIIACGIYSAFHRYKDVNSGAIIKYPMAIDKLKNLSSVIVPKDGVLTTRQYSVEYVCTPIRKYRLSDIRYRSALERPISLAVVSTGCYGADIIRGGALHASLDDEELAILSVARKLSLYHVGLDRTYPYLLHYGAGDSGSLFDTTVVKADVDYLAVMRGYPELILSRCTRYRDGDTVSYMSEKRVMRLREACRKLVRDAYTVIGIATRETSHPTKEFAAAAQAGMIFEGFIAYRVPMLRGVDRLIGECKRAGISVVLCDNGNDENSYFAKNIGISDHDDDRITGIEFENLTEEEKESVSPRMKVLRDFSKQQINDYMAVLQRRGQTVGYVGRTFDDIPSMKLADVSFAQNVTLSDHSKNGLIPLEESITPTAVAESVAKYGCEALKRSCDIVLSEADQAGNGGFRALVDAISYSKRINRNLLYMLRYLITSSVSRFLILVYGFLLGFSILSNVQIAFCGLIIDFIAVMILAFEKPNEKTLNLKSKTKSILDDTSTLLKTCCIFSVVWVSVVAGFAAILQLLPLGMSSTQIFSAVFVLWAVLQLLFLLIVKRDEGVFWKGLKINGIQSVSVLIIAELFLLLFLVPSLGARFSIVTFPAAVIPILLISAFAFCVLSELLKKEIILEKPERKQIEKKVKKDKDTAEGVEEEIESRTDSDAELPIIEHMNEDLQADTDSASDQEVPQKTKNRLKRPKLRKTKKKPSRIKETAAITDEEYTDGPLSSFELGNEPELSAIVQQKPEEPQQNSESEFQAESYQETQPESQNNLQEESQKDLHELLGELGREERMAPAEDQEFFVSYGEILDISEEEKLDEALLNEIMQSMEDEQEISQERQEDLTSVEYSAQEGSSNAELFARFGAASALEEEVMKDTSSAGFDSDKNT